GGWTIRFLGHAITGFDPTTVVSDFHIFVNSGWWPLLFSATFIAITMAIVARGVEKGIEQSSKILMPLLLIILVALCVNSMTLSGFTQGMSFLFEPDFSKITTQTVLDAVGQVFFTLSIGMGVMITYSSYVHKQENMLRSKIKVTIIDTLVAIISGVAIFPAVFTYGLSPSEGPSLVFLALPSVFAQMPFGNFIGVLFFALLFIAAITSAVSIFEMLTAVFMEKYRLTRTRALFTIGGGVFLLSVLSALSQVEDSALRLFGINFFDFLDMLSSNYLLTLGGLLTAIFTGWFFGRRALRAVFTSDGRYSVRFFPVFLFIIKYVSPIAVAAVFLSKLGLI
ncbi:MAG: sodium-dependent transporter, partial [Mucinivorans sp.]